MATTKPRISIMFEPETLAVLRRLSAIQGQSVSAIVGELVQTWAPVLAQLADVLEGAVAAEAEVKQNLARLAEEQERELLPVLDGAFSQYGAAIGEIQALLSRSEASEDPRPVTRGSGDPRKGSGIEGPGGLK